jgi:hypothetical protein
MAKRRRVSKKNLTTDLIKLAAGVAGGVAANQLTNFVEKQSFLEGKEQYAPLLTAAVGIGAYLFVPNEHVKAAAFGMVVGSGTEQVESLISESTSPTLPGTDVAAVGDGSESDVVASSRRRRGLGFTPSDGVLLRTGNNVSIR